MCCLLPWKILEGLAALLTLGIHTWAGGPLTQNVAHLRMCVLDGGLGLVPGCNSLLQGLGTAFHPAVCGLMSELLSTE